jgi:hypothetical protein
MSFQSPGSNGSSLALALVSGKEASVVALARLAMLGTCSASAPGAIDSATVAHLLPHCGLSKSTLTSLSKGSGVTAISARMIASRLHCTLCKLHLSPVANPGDKEVPDVFHMASVCNHPIMVVMREHITFDALLLINQLTHLIYKVCCAPTGFMGEAFRDPSGPTKFFDWRARMGKHVSAVCKNIWVLLPRITATDETWNSDVGRWLLHMLLIALPFPIKSLPPRTSDPHDNLGNAMGRIPHTTPASLPNALYDVAALLASLFDTVALSNTEVRPIYTFWVKWASWHLSFLQTNYGKLRASSAPHYIPDPALEDSDDEFM